MAKPVGKRQGAKRPKARHGRGARRDETAPAEVRTQATTYEVDFYGDDLRNFAVVTSPPRPDRRHRRCYEVLAGGSHPCVGCPVLTSARQPAPRREHAVLVSTSGPYRMAFAEPMGGSHYRVTMIQLAENAVANLQRARIDRKARQAGLSGRELSVLDLLLLGRSSDEIARALGITERTARFHVSNILAKLEADSRADLLRLFL